MWAQLPALLIATFLGACARESEPQPTGPASPAAEVPLILVAGCREVLQDGTCIVGQTGATLRLWVDQAQFGRLGVQVDGQPIELVAESVQGGSRLVLEVSEGASMLTVGGVDPPWTSSWTLPIAHESRAEVIVEARRRVTEEGVEHGEAWLEAQLPTLRDRSRLAALQELQGLAMQQDHLREAADRNAEIVALAPALGRLRAAARAANSAVYLYAYQLDELERVAPFLELLQDLSSRLPEARIWAGFSRGIAALRAGDLTGAVEGFAASASEAERLGLYDPLSTARQGLAVTYAELGRDEDARRLGRRLLDDAVAVGLSCALRFAALNTAGWIQLDLAQRERQDTAPSELFDEALALVEAGGECPSWSSEVDIRVSLALTALTEDDPAMALAWLEPVDTVLPSLQPWVHEVRARAGLALGRPRLMPSIVVAPPSSLPRHLRYNALMAQAAAREHYGLHAAAIDAYAEAEQVVDEAVGTIGIDLGRELFLSGQQLSALRLVEALIVAGRQPEALCRARQARARALRLLDRTARLGSATPEARGHWDAEVSVVARLQRQLDADATQDWQYSIQDLERRGVERAARRQQARQRLDDAYRRLGGSVNASDCDDLPALRSGEAMIVVLPLRRRWAVFVATATDVHANLVEAPQDAATLGVWTREAFAGAQPLVEGAQRLRILPIGRSWELDVHALPWGDGVLLDLAPLEYALDLQRREAVGGSRRAVVVSDPARDLPLAREEADAVQGALTKRGWSVERLDGDDATYDRVMSTLSGATLLHYAGHGEHGGVTGWGARMRIGKGEGIGVTEILAMPEVPATVVLSGCETGRVASETLEGGMSLARAFVLAGSRWVIASDRTVPDPLAFALGLALYDDPGLAGADPAVALRNAQRQLRDRHPGWAAFRLVVP